MTTVVDAGVAIKWFVEEPGHDRALDLLDRQDELFAPDCIVPEVVESVWQRVSRGQIENNHGAAIIAAITSGVPSLVAVGELAEDALRTSVKRDQFGCFSFYFACAEFLKADFVTADPEVAQKAREVLGAERVALLDSCVS